MPITSIWIEEDCIACDICEGEAPEVFHVQSGETSTIRGSVRQDGINSTNRDERSELIEIDESLYDAIENAAEGCPVEVIKYIRDGVEYPEV